MIVYKKETTENINTNIQYTQFFNFKAWNNPTPVDMLKSINQSINLINSSFGDKILLIVHKLNLNLSYLKPGEI